MDWNNVNLNDHEIDSYLIDPLTFSILLLEIECNLREINEATVTEQFISDLKSRTTEAINTFLANRDNIVKKALENRSED